MLQFIIIWWFNSNQSVAEKVPQQLNWTGMTGVGFEVKIVFWLISKHLNHVLLVAVKLPVLRGALGFGRSFLWSQSCCYNKFLICYKCSFWFHLLWHGTNKRVLALTILICFLLTSALRGSLQVRHNFFHKVPEGMTLKYFSQKVKFSFVMNL